MPAFFHDRKVQFIFIALLCVVSRYISVPNPYHEFQLHPETVEVLTPIFEAKNYVRLLAPLTVKVESGVAHYTWSVTTSPVIFAIQRIFGTYCTFYLLVAFHALAIAILTYKVTRNMSITSIVSCMLTLGVHYNYIYSHGNIQFFYLITVYLAVNLYFMKKTFFNGQPRAMDRLFFFASLLVVVFCSEQWLAYAAAVLSTSFAGFLICLRLKQYADKRRSFLSIFSIFFVVTIGYVFFRTLMHYEFSSQGTEEDLILNYSNIIIAFDDVMNNYFTFLYTIINTYLPPLFIGSSSFHFFDKDYLNATQVGYYSDYSQLVYYSHLFSWRYVAGMAFFAYLYVFVRHANNFIKTNRFFDLLAILLLIGISTSISHYLLIKMRPYNSVPALGYKVNTGVFLLTILIGMYFYRASQLLEKRKFRALLCGMWILVYANLFFKPFIYANWLHSVGLRGISLFD